MITFTVDKHHDCIITTDKQSYSINITNFITKWLPYINFIAMLESQYHIEPINPKKEDHVLIKDIASDLRCLYLNLNSTGNFSKIFVRQLIKYLHLVSNPDFHDNRGIYFYTIYNIKI